MFPAERHIAGELRAEVQLGQPGSLHQGRQDVHKLHQLLRQLSLATDCNVTVIICGDVPTSSMIPGTCSIMGARWAISKLVYLSHSACSPSCSSSW